MTMKMKRRRDQCAGMQSTAQRDRQTSAAHEQKQRGKKRKGKVRVSNSHAKATLKRRESNFEKARADAVFVQTNASYNGQQVRKGNYSLLLLRHLITRCSS
jgi:hypothetical protein